MSKPTAIDVGHHLSAVARAREPSPLKSLARYWGQPGIISLAGGFPCPTYFPFASIGGAVLPADAFPLSAPAPPADADRFGEKAPSADGAAVPISVAKYPSKAGDINLAYALQYNLAIGIPALRAFIARFTEEVYAPAYADYKTYVHAGNTDAWAIVLSTLCNPGEGYFTECFTYPSAPATSVPMGVRPVPVAIDAQGMRPDALRDLAANWDPAAHGGMPRPHVLYTVPVGQNPCGTVLGAARKQALYDVCVEFDIIIVEDDPYYFLQQDPYVAPAHRPAEAEGEEKAEESDAAFLARLVPTFLKFDTQGRVVRLDSFSKTIAPGSRLGWYTCHPALAERFERMAETSTQSPCGFGQALLGQLLAEQWGFEGYIRWLRGLRGQYNLRRDFMIDSIGRLFDLSPRTDEGVTVLEARATEGGAVLFEFVPPTGGMNLWFKLHLQNHPDKEADADALERGLWTALADGGLLVSPGWYFNAEELKGQGHFRLTYSFAEAGDIRRGMEVFARVLKREFGVEAKAEEEKGKEEEE